MRISCGPRPRRSWTCCGRRSEGRALKIALAQINPTVGDLKGNTRLIIGMARRARSAGATVVAFPELAVSGYPPEDLLLKDHFLLGCREALAEVAAGCADVVALVGVPLLGEQGQVFNAAAVLAGGGIVACHRKIMLPNYGVFDEKRYFTAGDRVLVVEVRGIRLGMNVCEDLWENAGPTLAAACYGGARIVVNLSMSPYHLGKGHEREDLLSRRAREADAYLFYVNGVGGQDELVFDGQSLVFDPAGRLLARACQFGEQLLIVDVETGAGGRPASGAAQGPTWPVEIVHTDLGPDAATRLADGAGDGDCAGVEEYLGLEAEVYAALRLGVTDYLAKNGFEKAVIGMSGGVDSALTACIAVDALGKDRVIGVSMPSRYSSAGTKQDARETAKRLGIDFYELPIDGIFSAYLDSLSPYPHEGEPGVTEQNIQARIRGNLLMALSNRFGWLVLTTGNKSEMAVGYATLYGDMAGGFAVIKDVPKTLVYRLAGYRNRQGPGSGPIPESTISRAPSAELAPDQVDQDTLPPYEVLDRIVEAYVVRDYSVEEITALGLDGDEVRRVVAMIDGNEYKRRQAPPGVRITPKAFGKDRRLPITNRFRG